MPLRVREEPALAHLVPVAVSVRRASRRNDAGEDWLAVHLAPHRKRAFGHLRAVVGAGGKRDGVMSGGLDRGSNETAAPEQGV